MEKGIIRAVENTNRKFGAADTYFAASLEKEGDTKVYLFTQKGLDEAEKRAKENIEDYEDLEFGGSLYIKVSAALILGVLLGVCIGSFLKNC